MAQQEHHTVRDDALRLTLSRQEGEYIGERLVAARKSLRIFVIVATCGGILLSITWLIAGGDHLVRLANSDAVLRSNLRNASLFIGAVAGIVTFIALLNIPIAWMNVAKYKKYRAEYGRFLERYSRQGGASQD